MTTTFLISPSTDLSYHSNFSSFFKISLKMFKVETESSIKCYHFENDNNTMCHACKHAQLKVHKTMVYIYIHINCENVSIAASISCPKWMWRNENQRNYVGRMARFYILESVQTFVIFKSCSLQSELVWSIKSVFILCWMWIRRPNILQKSKLKTEVEKIHKRNAW